MLALLCSGPSRPACGADRHRGDQQRRAGLPKPKSQNAATTLALLAGIAISMLGGIILLANLTGLKSSTRTGHSQFVENGRSSER